MAGQKLELMKRIAVKHNLPLPVAAKVLQMFLDTIIDSLAKEGRLELRDFGVFRVRNRKPMAGRNPRTGVQIALPPRRRVKFKMGRILKQRLR